MGVTLGSRRISGPHKPDRSTKRKSASAFGTSPWPAGRDPVQRIVHGALHDKSDDKLSIIKYDCHTRNFGGSKRDIGVPSAGVVQV
jgi:hypothetical protein